MVSRRPVGSPAVWLLALSAAAPGCADEERPDASGDKLVAAETASAPLNSDTCGSSPASHPIEAPAPSCSDLDVEACGDNAGCHTIEAIKFDERHTCRSTQASAVGCMPVTQPCTAAITYAKDTSGGTWQLTSGCVPTGWTTTSQPTATGTAVSAWPVCNDPLATSSGCPSATAMLSPGCGASKPTWEKGCYASCTAVGNDAGCAPGYTCQETWVDPCVPKPGESASCDACGELTHLCLASPAAP